MATESVTESRVVAKRKARPPEQPPADLDFERIEFQVPLGWTDRIDADAKAVGLSRSAYIRQAILLKRKKDKEDATD
jgi:hypothetical protein